MPTSTRDATRLDKWQAYGVTWPIPLTPCGAPASTTEGVCTRDASESEPTSSFNEFVASNRSGSEGTVGRFEQWVIVSCIDPSPLANPSIDVLSIDTVIAVNSAENDDNKKLQLYFGPAWPTNPGSTSFVSFPVASDFKPTAAGLTLLGEQLVTGPASMVVDCSSLIPQIGSTSEWAFYLFVDPTTSATGGPGGFTINSFQILQMLLRYTWETAPPEPEPAVRGPASLGFTGGFTGDCEANSLQELAQCLKAILQKLRRPVWDMEIRLTRPTWEALRPGYTFPIQTTSVGGWTKNAIVRIASRRFDGRAYTAQLDIIWHPDELGRNLNAERASQTTNRARAQSPATKIAGLIAGTKL